MATRTLTGVVTRANGTPFTGTLRVTPLEQIVTAGTNVAVAPVSFAVTAGALPPDAALVVPGLYEFAFIDGANELQCFQAHVPAGAAPVSLFDLSIAAYGAPPGAPGMVYLVAGSSVLLLAPGGGADGQFLARAAGALAWSDLPAPPGPPLPVPVACVFGVRQVGFPVTDLHTPTTPLEFNNTSGFGDGRMTIDLTHANEIRLNLVVTSTTEPPGAVATVQFSTDAGSNWTYLHATMLNIGLAVTGHRCTAWFTLPVAARADVQVRIVGYGGGGGTSCDLAMVKVDVR